MADSSKEICKWLERIADQARAQNKLLKQIADRMKDVTEGLESRTDLIWYGDKTDLIGDETGRHTGWFGKGADDE